MAPTGSVVMEHDAKPFGPFAFHEPPVPPLNIREEIRALKQEMVSIKVEIASSQGQIVDLRKGLIEAKGSAKHSLSTLEKQLTVRIDGVETRMKKMKTLADRDQAKVAARLERIQAAWAHTRETLATLNENFSAFGNVLSDNNARPEGSAETRAGPSSDGPFRNLRKKNIREPAPYKPANTGQGAREFCERCGKNLSKSYMKKHLLFVCH